MNIWKKRRKVREIGLRDTKASLGRKDAKKVEICLQTKASCGMGTDMDDSAAAGAVVVVARRRRTQRIKNIAQLALILGLLDEEGAVVSREHICSFCNVRRAAVTSLVHVR